MIAEEHENLEEYKLKIIDFGSSFYEDYIFEQSQAPPYF